MEFVYLGLATFITFWAILLFINKKFPTIRKNIQIFPFILIFKTQKFLKIIENNVATHSWFYKKLGNLLLFTTLILFFGTPLLFFVSAFFLDGSLITIRTIFDFEIVTIIIILLGLMPAIFIHEFAHAVLMFEEKIKVKFYGFLLLGIIVAFYVYPKEKAFSKAPRLSKLKISAAGIGANLLVSIVTLLIILALPLILLPGYSQEEGAWVVSVQNGSPASIGGIIKDDIITNLETFNINNKTSYAYKIASKDDLIRALEIIIPGSKLGITTTRSFHIILTNNQSKNIQLGIVVDNYYINRVNIFPQRLPYYLNLSLRWFSNLNLSIAIFNLIPIPLTDGEKIC